jgi:hypothetical protein
MYKPVMPNDDSVCRRGAAAQRMIARLLFCWGTAHGRALGW